MVELSAQLNNTISYQGCVQVTLNTKGHKRPLLLLNSGTKHLFDTITRALAGYSINGATPRYIDVQYKQTPEMYASALTSLIPFVGIVYGEAAEAGENDGRLLLNATITNDDKQPVAIVNSPRLVILDASKRVLAQIEGEQIKTLWDAITASTDAIVEWKLIFSN